MKSSRVAACALCLALLIPLLGHARRVLPIDTRPYVSKKYAGWSGVLRLWVCEDQPFDGLSGWLNRCVSRFEKRHPGVYVQPQSVDAGAITALNDSGILPPDLLLMPPGLLDDPAGLMPLDAPDGLRVPLKDTGAWQGEVYAVPVAMGGYLWAWNGALLPGIPDSWQEAGLSPAVPEPELRRHWGAALLALCAGTREGEAELPDTLPGLELGLPDGAPTPAPTAHNDRAELLPCRLPEGFDFDSDAYRRFINGEVAATVVTQREVRRLEALSAQGRGPDWRLSAGTAAFTDQLLFLAVTEKPEGDERIPLCVEFLETLLSEECQGELCRASAVGVTDAASGYGPGDSLILLETALRDPALAAARCFGNGWRAIADDIVRRFVADQAPSPRLWRELAATLD